MVYVVHTNVLPTFSKAFWTFSKKFQPLRAVGTKVLKAAQEFLVVFRNISHRYTLQLLEPFLPIYVSEEFSVENAYL